MLNVIKNWTFSTLYLLGDHTMVWSPGRPAYHIARRKLSSELKGAKPKAKVPLSDIHDWFELAESSEPNSIFSANVAERLRRFRIRRALVKEKEAISFSNNHEGRLEADLLFWEYKLPLRLVNDWREERESEWEASKCTLVGKLPWKISQHLEILPLVGWGSGRQDAASAT